MSDIAEKTDEEKAAIRAENLKTLKALFPRGNATLEGVNYSVSLQEILGGIVAIGQLGQGDQTLSLMIVNAVKAVLDKTTPDLWKGPAEQVDHEAAADALIEALFPGVMAAVEASNAENAKHPIFTGAGQSEHKSVDELKAEIENAKAISAAQREFAAGKGTLN